MFSFSLFCFSLFVNYRISDKRKRNNCCYRSIARHSSLRNARWSRFNFNSVLSSDRRPLNKKRNSRGSGRQVGDKLITRAQIFTADRKVPFLFHAFPRATSSRLFMNILLNLLDRTIQLETSNDPATCDSSSTFFNASFW